MWKPAKAISLPANQDNTINIKAVKNSFSKEEVVELILRYRSELLVKIFKKQLTEEFTDKFIEQNLNL